MKHHASFHWLVALLLTTFLGGPAAGAVERYVGTCNVEFEGDSTLHAFTGHITNIALVVFTDTLAPSQAVLNTRLEIKPRHLTTHHKKRDANMYKMFQEDRFPSLILVVTNASLAAARLSSATPPAGPGELPLQLIFCGITNQVIAHTVNPQAIAEGWEFDLDTTVSLKAFKLEPPSTLLGAISVKDSVKVKAHVKLRKEPPKT